MSLKQPSQVVFQIDEERSQAVDDGPDIKKTPSHMDKIKESAVLPELSRAEWSGWTLIAVLSQLAWGLYPVCTRFLQTGAYPIPTLQLAVVMNLIALPGLVIFYTIPSKLRAYHRVRCERKALKAAADEEQRAGQGSAPGSLHVEEEMEAAGGVVGEDGNKEEARSEEDSPKPLTWKEWLRKEAIVFGLSTFVGAMIALQALTNIYAAKFTVAYLVQLVFMFAPLVVALTNTFVLGQPTPPRLYPTLAVALLGAGAVLVGQWLQTRSDPSKASGMALGPSTAWGLLLAFVSTLLLAAYLVLVQVTRHLITGEQVLWGRRNVAILLFVPLSLGIEGLDWSWVLHLSPFSWGVLWFAGLVIYTISNILLQSSIRRIGSPLVSVFMSLRLIASILGSIGLLHDIPTNPVTWVGFGIVIGVMTAFLVLQFVQAKKKPEAASEAPAGGDPVDATGLSMAAVDSTSDAISSTVRDTSQLRHRGTGASSGEVQDSNSKPSAAGAGVALTSMGAPHAGTTPMPSPFSPLVGELPKAWSAEPPPGVASSSRLNTGRRHTTGASFLAGTGSRPWGIGGHEHLEGRPSTAGEMLADAVLHPTAGLYDGQQLMRPGGAMSLASSMAEPL